jgi:hypothetical protein
MVTACFSDSPISSSSPHCDDRIEQMSSLPHGRCFGGTLLRRSSRESSFGTSLSRLTCAPQAVSSDDRTMSVMAISMFCLRTLREHKPLKFLSEVGVSERVRLHRLHPPLPRFSPVPSFHRLSPSQSWTSSSRPFHREPLRRPLAMPQIIHFRVPRDGAIAEGPFNIVEPRHRTLVLDQIG